MVIRFLAAQRLEMTGPHEYRLDWLLSSRHFDYPGVIIQKETAMPDFQLKEYQQVALDALSEYYRACLTYNEADTAFYALTKRPYNPVKELPGLPYVCLRLPTGAGKTFVACHAVNRTIREYQQTDNGLVVWLLPPNALAMSISAGSIFRSFALNSYA